MSERKRPAPPETQEVYDAKRIQLALSYAPRIYPCKKCRWPCVVGYCCNTCGDTNPSVPATTKAGDGEQGGSE